jgi:hypothetical protein
MLVSGLNSILFAINIDNSNLNLATKLNYNKSSQNQVVTSAQSKETTGCSNPVRISPKLNDETPNDTIRNNSFNGNSLAVLNLTNDAKASNTKNVNNRKVRKNNVVLDDDDDEQNASLKKAENRSKTTTNLLTNSSGNNLLQNGSYAIVKSKSISELSRSSSINNRFDMANSNNIPNLQDQGEEEESDSRSLSHHNSNQPSLKSDSYNNFDESKLVTNSNTNKKPFVNNSNVSDTSEDSTTERANFEVYK